MKRVTLIAAAALFCLSAGAEQLKVQIQPGEKWWGGVDDPANRRIDNPTPQPFDESSCLTLDLTKHNYSNNSVPFFVSTKGRYVWSDEAFTVTFKKGDIIFEGEGPFELNSDGANLREAYKIASSRHFAPSGIMPPEEFIASPQYNTWIELIYNQNQKDILNYAESIVRNGFPTGSVLMIDDNWQKYYGNFEFKPEKFPDPEGMCRKLHEMGFKIMLWVAPYISPDSPEYRFLEKKGYLILDAKGKYPAIYRWWNGQSAIIDLSNPKAKEWFVVQLKENQKKYGVDGFKFDAGDVEPYDKEHTKVADGKSYGVKQSLLWNKLSEEFPYNEFRASWKMGGQAAVMRLCDKKFNWEDVGKLVPSMIAAGMEGHIYICPDMIGGGEFVSFLDLEGKQIDQELVVRSCQIHSMMPMMQFSVAPWRILSKENCEICRKAALKHKELAPYLLEQATKSSKSGEPLVRAMEYSFPSEGFEDCTDQYMLGEKYLVAPMTAPGTTRTVRLPKGRWQDEQGKKYKGGRTYTIEVPIERTPIFTQL